MEMYKVSHVYWWSDLKYGGELVVFGLTLMRQGHGGFGFNLGLFGMRLSVHFNTKSSIERERLKWEHAKKSVKELTELDIGG